MGTDAGRLIALEYHDVIAGADTDASGFPGAAAGSYKLSADDFDAHLEAIGRVAECGTVDTFLGGAAARRRVLLTFDDGGRSARAEVADRLEQRRWRGHFFVTTDVVGTPSFLGEREIRELHERGHVVGSHSCSHPLRMSAQKPAQLAREWRDSRSRLEDIVGAPVTTASVPGGGLSRAVIATAAEAGYRALFTSEPVTRAFSFRECLVIGRFTLRRDTPATVAGALAAGRLTPRASQWVAWNGKKLLKAAGGSMYLRLREALLDARA
jgi:peptidoglycan/xylan/chitin deacetylase (PgdA/CDA1 family)